MVAAEHRWTHKHLLAVEELSVEDIRYVFDTADSFKEVSTRSIKKVPALIKDGRVFAIVMIIIVSGVTFGLLKFFPAMLTIAGQNYASNKTLSIGVGGAYGIVMLLNVWGIIWPNNKRMIGAMTGGPPAAPELARQAFVASRTNAWMSLPMLLFMGTSHGDWLIFSGK